MPTATKTCTGCGRELPLTSFHKQGDRPNRASRCKLCRSVAHARPSATLVGAVAEAIVSQLTRESHEVI